MTVRHRHARVTMGSPRFHELRSPLVDVVAAWFPPNAQIASHTHAKAVFGVMLAGGFRTRILGREVDYLASGAWTEPAEERHTNLAGYEGAQVLIVQPGTAAGDLADDCRRLLDEIVYIQSAELAVDASRLEAECVAPDELSPLVAEGTALAMLARASRIQRRRLHHERGPRWLQDAVDYLHAHMLERINFGQLAASVGVHPTRLAHEFRRRLGASPGEYARQLRLAWAADRLRENDSGIAEIAIRAGFCDQSHFSRTFRRQFGMAPAAWRQSRLRGRNA
jgi:AraC family transcriptional regulator